MPRRLLPALAAALLGAFAALAARVAVAGGVPGDERAVAGARSASSEALDVLARLVDPATGYEAVGVLALLATVVLACRGHARNGLLVAASVGGAVVGTTLLKRLVDRPRPDLAPLEGVSPLSFPSGHAAATAALAVAVVLAASGTRRFRAAVAAATALVVVAAAAQLLLGLHHPSDLAGGWLWAGAWTLAVWSVAGRERPGATPTPT